jgi:hypothetical protein
MIEDDDDDDDDDDDGDDAPVLHFFPFRRRSIRSGVKGRIDCDGIKSLFCMMFIWECVKYKKVRRMTFASIRHLPFRIRSVIQLPR